MFSPTSLPLFKAIASQCSFWIHLCVAWKLFLLLRFHWCSQLTNLNLKILHCCSHVYHLSLDIIQKYLIFVEPRFCLWNKKSPKCLLRMVSLHIFECWIQKEVEVSSYCYWGRDGWNEGTIMKNSCNFSALDDNNWKSNFLFDCISCYWHAMSAHFASMFLGTMKK